LGKSTLIILAGIIVFTMFSNFTMDEVKADDVNLVIMTLFTNKVTTQL